MNFDRRAVQGDDLDFYSYNLSLLKLFEYSIEDAVLGPTVHPGINGMPVAEPFRKTAPLAALLGYKQDRVQNL